jgi:predicted PurR-regulated permease PerM
MTLSRRWFWLSIFAITTLLIYLLAPVLTPFLVAAILAYVGDPWVDRLEKRLPRAAAVSVVYAMIIGVIAGLLLVLIPLLQQQLATFADKLPVYIDRLQTQFIPWVSALLGMEKPDLHLDELKSLFAERMGSAGGVAAGIFATVSQSGMALALALANLLLIPVLTFYLLRDWDVLVGRVHELIPRRVEPVISRLARQSDDVLGAFLRGQVLVMLGLGTVYSVGLWMVGVDFSLLIGMLAGLVSFVPYLGFVVGILVAGIAAMLQFQDAYILLPILAVLAVGQLLESFVFTPLLVGDRIGLHPVAVIFAVMAGGQLFGFFGILLALPVAAVVMVLLRHAHERYINSGLYAQADDGDTRG